MTKKFTILLAFLLAISSSLISQNFYYGPDGKTVLEISKEKILVSFSSGVDFSVQERILNNFPELENLQKEDVLPAPQLTLVNLKEELTGEEILNLLDKLEATGSIRYAGYFLAHKDGTLHGITDRVLVRVKQASHEDRLRNKVAEMGAKVDSKNEFDSQLYLITVDENSAGNALEVANSLAESGLFEFAEPDFLRLMQRFNTNDPYVGDQWSLENDGTNTSQYGGTAGADMKVFNAWGTTTGSSSIKVAIIDEGVDLNHPDLQANLLGGYDATGQGSGGGPQGDDAHGTACAGIVAAVGNNSTGVAGVAYNSKIIPVRIAYSSGNSWVTTNSWIGNAINWSWQTANADVLSNSWGGGGSSSTINNAISGAVNNGRGGLGSPVLFAAGNDNGANSYPATYSPTISVIAMSMCNQRKSPSSCDGETWWGSNYGTGADIAAPGVKIYATDISGSAGYSSGNYVSNFNGTSSACPNAAGVMALILSANASLTEDQARAALESTCDKVGGYSYSNVGSSQPNGTWSNDLGYGRVNAYAAVLSVSASVANDAGISSVNAPSGNICASSASPQVVLNNYGSNTLTSVTINYNVDGGSNSTYNWSGNLASLGSTTVNLPVISFSGGNHSFNASTSNPNGQTDENTNNDDASSSFISGSNNITLTIVLDNYPEETSWEIKDGATVLASGGTYGSYPDGSTVTENICLADGCFDFIIYDTYGDGICCGYGNGSYTLTDDSNGSTLASGGSFGSSETTNFCVTGTPPVLGCTDPGAHNYDPNATQDDGSCETCSDGIQNGDETGVDCGGALCNDCPVLGCTDSSAHNYDPNATQDDGSCETCDDGVLNGDEEQIDCGGALCVPCSTPVPGCTDPGAHNYDPNATQDDGSCETCDDGILNGDETDVDCGGALCNDCPVPGCTDPGAHNYDPNATQDDGSCETCDDGILNGDETDVDCGGALCDPCDTGGCNYEVIDFNNFNNSWGIWNDGGSDCRRSANDAAYAVGGTGRPVRLRDNTSSSTMTTDNLNLTAYEELTVDFSYYPRSMDNSNEDFWLQISTNGGSSYTTVEEWNLNDEFVNNQRYYDAVVIQGPFTSNTRLRFRCDASGNSDWIYIDDVEISGCTTGSSSPSGSFAGTPEDIKPADTIEEPMVDLNLFPNPTRDQLTVSFQLTQDATVQLMVTDLNGKIVNQQQLSALKGNVKTTIDASNFGSGVYMVHLLTDKGRLNGKFIVVD